MLKPGAVADETALITHCRYLLASFKKPRSVRFVNALPRSHYGKVQRAQLIADLLK